MALKLCRRDNRYLAKLVTGKGAPCAFCLREVDDEITFGKLYAIGDIQCHYFCCLLSCCLIQKGHDEEGLFGFMYTDILAEIERCKKHKCSYCNRTGANLGCCVTACRKQFHLPCGREKNAVSLYYGSYKSFCQQHAPKQRIPDHIMAKARLRIKLDRMRGKNTSEVGQSRLKIVAGSQSSGEPSEEMVCVICYETVDGFPTVNTFWPPCCAKDAWFHRSCLQRMALSAGMHYLKCPLCNDKENFYEAVVSQGYYVPDRDAAWELEQNAFAEIYERPATCSAEECSCPMGRSHDEETGKWDIKLCILCGSAGAHAHCIGDQSQPARKSLDQSQPARKSLDQSQPARKSLDQSQPTRNSLDQSQTREVKLEPMNTENASSIDQSQNALNEDQLLDQSENATNRDTLPLDQSQRSARVVSYIDQSQRSTDDESCNNQSQKTTDKETLRYVCRSCLPAAPEDLNSLVSSIEAIIQQEQAETVSSARRLVMPSRMSLRRTKGRLVINAPSSSRANNIAKTENGTSSPNTQSSRRELNLKTPRRCTESNHSEKGAENKFLSPVKLLEQSFREKVVCTGVRDAVLDESVIEALRRKFRKPRPLCEKKRIVNDILDGLFDDLLKNSKQKEQIKEWCSPRKSYNSVEDSKELTEVNDASKTPEKQNKENDSKALNTPTKHPNTIKANTPTFKNKTKHTDETLNNSKINTKDNKQGEPKTEEKVTERCKKLSETVDIDCNKSFIDTEIDKTAVVKENCRKTRSSLSKTLAINFNRHNELNNEITENSTIEKTNQTENKMTETPSRNKKRKNKTSLSKTVINHDGKHINSKNDVIHLTDKEIEESPKTIKKHTTNGKNSTPETMTDVEKLETNTLAYKIFDKIEDTQTDKQRVSPLKILIKKKRLRLNKNKHNSTNGKSLKTSSDKDLGNTENVESENSRNKLPNKVLPKAIVKSKPAFKGFPHPDGSILKRLLTEKDLCSQLLLELTTGKTNDKTLIENPPKGLETLNTSVETAEGTSESPKNSLASPNNSEDSPNNPIETSNNSIESPINSHESLKNSTVSLSDSQASSNNTLDFSNKSESPYNSIDSSNNSVVSPNNSLVSPNNSIDFNIVETPKRKTIDIQQDSSLEISENDQSINIDVIKIEETPSNRDAYKTLKINIPEKNKKCAFKFSPLDKETLEKNNVGIDLESFKKEYLSEVDREFTCNFRHKHVDKICDGNKLRTAIDFAIDATIKKEEDCDNVSLKNSKKRKLSDSGVLLFDNSVVKKRKTSESDLKLSYFDDKKTAEVIVDDLSIDAVKKKKHKNKLKKNKKDKRKAKKNKKVATDKNIEVTIDSSEKRRGKNKKKKIKTKFAIRNEDIHLKIKWKKKQLSLNIESKKQAKKEKIENSSKFKQYVLQFPEGSSSKEVLTKPEKEISPVIKKKRVHQEKGSDKLKQMSIHSFFKMKSPEE